MGASDSLRSSSRSNAGWKNHQCVCCSTGITYEKCHTLKNSSLISESKTRGDKRKIKDNKLGQRPYKIRKICKSEIQKDKKCADQPKTKWAEKCGTNHIIGLETLGKRSFQRINLTESEVKQVDCSGSSKDLKVKSSIQIKSKEENRKVSEDDKFCERSKKVKTCTLEKQKDRRCANKSKTKLSARVLREESSENKTNVFGNFVSRHLRSTNLIEGVVNTPYDSVPLDGLKVKKDITVKTKKEKRKEPKNDKICKKSEEIKTCTLEIQKDTRCANESKTKLSARVLRVKRGTKKINVFPKFSSRSFESTNLPESEINKISDSIPLENLKVKNSIQARTKKSKKKRNRPKTNKICEKSEEIGTCALEIHKDSKCADKSKINLNDRSSKEKCNKNKISCNQSFESTNLNEDGINQPVGTVPLGDLKFKKNSSQVRTKQKKRKRAKDDEFCKKLEKTITNYSLEVCNDKSKSKVKVLKSKVNCRQSKRICVKDKGCINKKNCDKNSESTCLMNDGIFQLHSSVLLRDVKKPTNSISDSTKPSLTEDMTFNNLSMSFLDTSFWQQVIGTDLDFQKEFIINYNTVKNIVLESIDTISQNRNVCEIESICGSNVTLNNNGSINISSEESISHFDPNLIDTSVGLESNKDKEAKSNKPSAPVKFGLPFDGICGEKINLTSEELNPFPDSCNTFDAINSTSDELSESIPFLQNEQLNDFSAVLDHSDMPELNIMGKHSFAVENICSKTCADLHQDLSLKQSKAGCNNKDNDKHNRIASTNKSTKSDNQLIIQEIGNECNNKDNNKHNRIASTNKSTNSEKQLIIEEIRVSKNDKINMDVLIRHLSDNYADCIVVEKCKASERIYKCGKCCKLFEIKTAHHHKNCNVNITSVLIDNLNFICLKCYTLFENLFGLSIHKESCLLATKSATNEIDHLYMSGYNKSLTSIEKTDLISIDNISVENHLSNFSSRHVKDQNSLIEQSQSNISSFTSTQYKKQNTDKRTQEQNHCETSNLLAENTSVNDNLASKVLSPKKQNSQSVESNKDVENSQCKLTDPVAADFTTKSSYLNSEGFNESMYMFKLLNSLKASEKFSDLSQYESLSDQLCYFPSSKIKKEPESVEVQIPLVPETCRKCRKPLHFDVPIVEKTSSSIDSNNPLQLNLFCSACKFLYPVVIRKEFLDILTQFLDQSKNCTKDAFLEEHNDDGNKIEGRIKIKEEIIENVLPHIDQVVSISRDNFFKMNEIVTPNCWENLHQHKHSDTLQQKIVQNIYPTENSHQHEHSDTVKQKIVQNIYPSENSHEHAHSDAVKQGKAQNVCLDMNNSLESSVVPDILTIPAQMESASVASCNLTMKSSIQNPVVPNPSSNLEQLGSIAVPSHNEQLSSIQEQIIIPSDIIIDFDFDSKEPEDLWMKDSLTYLCGECFITLMKDEIAKHFYEKHKILKTRFNVLDASP